MASVMAPTPAPMRAGGRATEAGMGFQAAVATWFASHILAGCPVGGRFGMGNAALPVAIRLETGEGLDDIEVAMSDGGAIHVQCKTSANLGTGENAPLVKTLAQLALFVSDAKLAGNALDPARTAAVLAVHSDAARSLDKLEAGCRAFDLGGVWSTTRAQRNAGERDALERFGTTVAAAWTARRSAAPDDIDLVDMARVFHISRFSMDEGGADWREASRLLGRTLFGSEPAGDTPLRDLRGIVRDLIGSGAPADRSGLLRALRQRGHSDVGAPGFDNDIARLRDATASELIRLRAHTVLPLEGGLSLAREVDAPLRAAMVGAPLLVIGEPGAGKTGALVAATSALESTGHEVVFLSVDRYSGVSIAADLVSELRLSRPVLDVLAAWPGSNRKILVIDALDAARGGASESVFATLIEDVIAQLQSDWTVVASIRTFDLKNGRRFRLAFAGVAADPSYSDSTLMAVRHVLVPRLSARDLSLAGNSSQSLGALISSSPSRLAELLRNIFNLSLAAQLLADGVDPAQFSSIGTQSGLIDAYEDTRLGTSQREQAAAAAVASMVTRLRLSVRKMTIPHPDLDAVIQSGVLTVSGDLVSFAHHVLFDHAAGRFYLAWDNPTELLEQVEGNTSTALLLAPALRFAVERLWRTDNADRSQVWQLALGIFAAPQVDPVLGNVALRVLAESVECESDLNVLISHVSAGAVSQSLATLLGRLTQFAAITLRSSNPIAVGPSLAWARLAEALIATNSRLLLQSAHDLLFVLFERGDLSDSNLAAVFGRAARGFLAVAWSSAPPLPAANPIRFVGKSFGSDVAESRALLQRTLRDPHFSLYADQEAGWVAEQIISIARSDPNFAVEIYAAFYSQTISDQATTFIGGRPSRIMPLLTNRKQDFEHCRWRLGTSLAEFLRIAPEQGTRAVIEADVGLGMSRGYGGIPAPEHVELPTGRLELRSGAYEFHAWDAPPGNRNRDDEPLHRFVLFLRSCDVAAFAASIASASRAYATSGVWLRIFGVGNERAADVGHLLWGICQTPGFLRIPRIAHEVLRLVATVWATRSTDEHHAFEAMILDETRHAPEEFRSSWNRSLTAFLSDLPESAFVLEDTRALRRSLPNVNAPREHGTDGPDGLGAEAFDTVRDTFGRGNPDEAGGPVAEIVARSDALYAQTQSTPTESSAAELGRLWHEAFVLFELLVANPDLTRDADCPAWGHVSNAVERVATSRNFEPGQDGLPDLIGLFAVLDRLTASRYPEPRGADA